jgi:hypothetical protein
LNILRRNKVNLYTVQIKTVSFKLNDGAQP